MLRAGRLAPGRGCEGVLALILANGRGRALEGLTAWQTKAAVPFGGQYRIVDFVLSNCVNSEIRSIALLTQYKSQSLIRHVHAGWGFLHRELGEFIEVWPAQQQDGERWYRGTRSRSLRLRALDVEGRREARPLSRGDEAQRLVLGGRDSTHRVELSQCADEREVVGCDVAYDEQANTSLGVFRRPGVGRCRCRARAQTSGDVDFPRHVDAALPPFGIRSLGERLLDVRSVVGAVVEAVGMNADAREEEGAADRLAGSGCTHTLGRDLDVPVLRGGPANEVRQCGVAVAIPPCNLDFRVGSRRPGESCRHVDRRLEDRRRAPDQSEDERRGEHGGDVAQGAPTLIDPIRGVGGVAWRCVDGCVASGPSSVRQKAVWIGEKRGGRSWKWRHWVGSG